MISLACTSTPTCSTRSAWRGGWRVGPPGVPEVTPTRGSAVAGTGCAREPIPKVSDDRAKTQTAAFFIVNSPSVPEDITRRRENGSIAARPVGGRLRGRENDVISASYGDQRQGESGAGALDVGRQGRVGRARADARDDAAVHVRETARPGNGNVEQPAVAGHGDAHAGDAL